MGGWGDGVDQDKEGGSTCAIEKTAKPLATMCTAREEGDGRGEARRCTHYWYAIVRLAMAEKRALTTSRRLMF